ncbi:MAG: signal peptidase II [Nanoarchaeota archaeon]
MVNWKIFLIALIVLILDRITKIIFIDKSVKNYGAAFSLLQGLNIFFIIVAAFVIGLIIYYNNVKNFNLALGMGFVLGGALGNMIDRILYNGVIDFIRIWIFPVFNLADLFNVIGGLIIVYYLWDR